MPGVLPQWSSPRWGQEAAQFHLLDGSGEREFALPSDPAQSPDPTREETEITITDMEISDDGHFLYLYGIEEGADFPEEGLCYLFDLRQEKWLPLPPWTKGGKKKGNLTISSDGAAAVWLDNEASALRIFFAGNEEAAAEIRSHRCRTVMLTSGRGMTSCM